MTRENESKDSLERKFYILQLDGVGGVASAVTFPTPQHVIVDSAPEIEIKNDVGNPVPVSGTFFQATQPITGSVGVTNFPASQPVTGTFFQATQPVSGSIGVNNFPASQPVTGTFFPAQQSVIQAADLSTTGTITAATQTVVLALGNAQSSFTVQATGTFAATCITEVTADGTTWVPVNTRQSNGGRLANNFSSVGLFRGVSGGVAAVRVRCSAFTSGTINITIRVGGPAAVFSNSEIVIQQQAQYYAASSGLNAMYSASSDIVTTGLTPTDLPYFSLYNPAGNTNPIYIYRMSMGGGQGSAGIYKRKRFTGVPTGGTAVTSDNRAGVGNTAMGLVVKSATGLTLPGTPVLQRTTNIASNAQETLTEDFSLIVPVGQGIALTYTGASNSIITGNVVWSEGSTLT